MMKGETEGWDGEGEPLSEVLERAETAGYSVTRRQLKRWRDEGFVPSPRKTGLGWGRGTVSLYPPGTGQRVVEIARALERERSFDWVEWHLWATGHLSHDRLRSALAEGLASLARGLIQALRDFEEGDPSNPIDRADRGDLEQALLKLRDLVGPEVFAGVVRLFLQGFRDQPSAEEIERQLRYEREELFEGFRRVIAPLLASLEVDEPLDLDAEELAGYLEELFKKGEPENLREYAESVPDAELDNLRERAQQAYNLLFPDRDGQTMTQEVMLMTIAFDRLGFPYERLILTQRITPELEDLLEDEQKIAEGRGEEIWKGT